MKLQVQKLDKCSMSDVRGTDLKSIERDVRIAIAATWRKDEGYAATTRAERAKNAK